MQKLIFPILLSLFALYGYSQTSDSTYQKYLQNPQNVPKRVYYSSDNKNILKTDLGSIIDGNIPLIWEHRFSDHFSIDGGVGVTMKYSINSFISNNDNYGDSPWGLNTRFRSDKPGYSFQLEPRLNIADNSPLIGKGSLFVSLYHKQIAYPRLNISESGIGYGYSNDFEHTSLQFIFLVLYLHQVKASESDEFKYSGDLFQQTNSRIANGFVASIRIQFGFILDSKMKPHK